MATTLIREATSQTNKAASSLRFPPINLILRSLTTSSSSSSSSSSPATDAAPPSTRSKKRKKKNLFEVAQFLPNWGVGYHLAKSHWTNVAYEITKINLYKDGKHGKAWGIAYKDGSPAADAPKKISGVHKRCWRYIPSSLKPKDSAAAPSHKLVQATADAGIQTA